MSYLSRRRPDANFTTVREWPISLRRIRVTPHGAARNRRPQICVEYNASSNIDEDGYDSCFSLLLLWHLACAKALE